MYVDHDKELYEKSLYYRHVVDEKKEIGLLDITNYNDKN